MVSMDIRWDIFEQSQPMKCYLQDWSARKVQRVTNWPEACPECEAGSPKARIMTFLGSKRAFLRWLLYDFCL